MGPESCKEQGEQASRLFGDWQPNQRPHGRDAAETLVGLKDRQDAEAPFWKSAIPGGHFSISAHVPGRRDRDE